jgi:hypothetical protein
MKFLISLLFLTLLSMNLFAADDLYTPKTQGSVSIIDNTGRIWQAQVVYTTDGNGNVLPISGGGGGGGCAGVKTPGLLVATSSGTVAAGATEVSFLVTSATPVLVLGVSLAQGEYVNYKATDCSTLAAIAYNATGGTLKISEVR